MTPEAAQRAVDPFYTTRTTRKVGLGLPFLKMAAEMTGGGLSIQSQPGCGTRVCAQFGLHHIDRAPIGDMSSTIAGLIQCSPDIDFVYTVRAAGGEFVPTRASCVPCWAACRWRAAVAQWLREFMPRTHEPTLRRSKLI